ncbi:MAG: polyphosphate polymerase domain-containing protein [Propionicimonas sp.]
MTATLQQTATQQATTRRVELAWLPTTSLERLLGQAALQTRIDRKYVLPVDDVALVLGLVEGPVEVLRIDGRERFGYHSTYFDTPGLDCFHLAGRGRRRRFKVRTRVYRDSGDTWLEVKTRGPRGATVKDRLPYDLADAGRLTPAAAEFVSLTLTEREADGVAVADLAPALHTSYDRTTLLLAGGDSASRATIDTRLTWRRPGSRHLLATPGTVIVETKGGSAPSALDRALWRCRIRPSRVSKYGTGLAALNDDLPDLKWHRVLTHELIPTAAQPA